MIRNSTYKTEMNLWTIVQEKYKLNCLKKYKCNNIMK